MSNELLALEDFRGVARLFPLPDVVLFPTVVQPLHIFEPRYRQLTADALSDDRLIALVLLKPGWEEDYALRPPVHSIACLGRILNEQKIKDGRYNLLLHGLRRIRIVKELAPVRLYREARVELLDERAGAASPEEKVLRSELSKQLLPLMKIQAGAREQAEKLLASDLPLGRLCDLFGFALPLESSIKQQLLEEMDVARRAHTLLEHLRTLEVEPVLDRKFPPDFSSN